MRPYLQLAAAAALSIAGLDAAASGHALLPEAELERRMAVLGDDFLITSLEGPVIDNPADWIQRRAGSYTYRYVSGSDDGKLEQTELHIPDSDKPDTVWKRRVGDNLVETFVRDQSQDVLIIEDMDLERGFRVVIRPGVHLRANMRPGDSWENVSQLDVYDLEDGELFRNGELKSAVTYEGAFRVRTPAGVFDTVLIREDFRLDIGPLSAEDDRFLFFARDTGLVAEIEGIKASAMLIINTRDESAKLLVDFPRNTPAEDTAAKDLSAAD